MLRVSLALILLLPGCALFGPGPEASAPVTRSADRAASPETSAARAEAARAVRTHARRQAAVGAHGAGPREVPHRASVSDMEEILPPTAPTFVRASGSSEDAPRDAD